MTSIFENDIKGDGGLRKSGNGTLILTGNNSYAGDTTIDEGKLEIYGNNTSDITISSQGTLVMYPTAIINKKDGVPKSVLGTLLLFCSCSQRDAYQLFDSL